MSDTLQSPNGRFSATIQNDGNFCLYDRGTPYWATNTVVDDGPAPSPQPVNDVWPRLGLSYYTSLTDPRLDLPGFVTRLQDAGATLTRVWLIDAWAVGSNAGPGCYDGLLPWEKMADGRYDLWHVSQPYLDHLREYVERMNQAGILPMLTGWELYSWSTRKAGMLWVPDAARGPFRKNRNNIFYADDGAFETIGKSSGEDAFLGHFYLKAVTTLSGLTYTVELGNEMPEKPLHERLAARWREAGYQGHLCVNRQDDTPGQSKNMRVGQPNGYDRIAFHGRSDLGYLDERFEDEPQYKTFREFYASDTCDPRRIILSSDGCRKSIREEDAYDYGPLGEVFLDARARGFSVEHQGCWKLRGFHEGRIDLDDIKYDLPMLRLLQ